MLRWGLSLVVVACAAFSGSSAWAGGWVCPIWELQEWDGMKVYYAEYQEMCGDEPESVYLIGNYDWPTICPNGCIPVDEVTYSLKNNARPSRQSRLLAQGWGPATDRFVMPAGKSQKFSKQTSRMAVRFDHDGDSGTPDKQAFCYTYVTDPKAMGLETQPKTLRFGFEALEEPQEAKVGRVAGKRDFTYQIEVDGNRYAVQLR
jgi:hypothetical protein